MIYYDTVEHVNIQSSLFIDKHAFEAVPVKLGNQVMTDAIQYIFCNISNNICRNTSATHFLTQYTEWVSAQLLHKIIPCQFYNIPFRRSRWQAYYKDGKSFPKPPLQDLIAPTTVICYIVKYQNIPAA